MQYLIVIIFIATYLLSDLSVGYYELSPLYTHFTYMFQHAGWMHLILNSLAFIGLYRALSKELKFVLLRIILIAFVGSFMSVYLVPTVGASGMIYAMLGMCLGLQFTGRWKLKNLKFVLFSIAFMLLISFFKHTSNFGLHVWCLVFGVLDIMFSNFILRDDRHSTD